MAGRARKSKALDGGDSEALINKALPVILPIAVSFLAATALAMLRNSYVKFYGAFGVTPEDVGISQTQVLSGVFHFCLGGAFLRTYTPHKAITLGVMAVLVWYLVSRFCYTSRRLQERVPGTPGRVIVAIAIYFILVLTTLLAFGAVVIPHDQKLAYRRITMSQALRSEELSLLTIHAFPTEVVTVDKSIPVLPAGTSTGLMFLGRTESTTILYDPTTTSTLRIPTGLIALRLSRQPLTLK